VGKSQPLLYLLDPRASADRCSARRRADEKGPTKAHEEARRDRLTVITRFRADADRGGDDFVFDAQPEADAFVRRQWPGLYLGAFLPPRSAVCLRDLSTTAPTCLLTRQAPPTSLRIRERGKMRFCDHFAGTSPPDGRRRQRQQLRATTVTRGSPRCDATHASCRFNCLFSLRTIERSQIPFSILTASKDRSIDSRDRDVNHAYLRSSTRARARARA